MRTELTDGNIVLRPYRAEDVNALYEAVRESIAELSPWLSWCHEGYTIDETRAFLASLEEAMAKGEAYDFGVFDAQAGDFLGGVGVNNIVRSYRYANLGYWMRTSRTGRGIASDAARLLARFGIEDLGLGRIEIVAAVSNVASRRVAEKTGAVLEGILRKRLRLHGQPHDAALYSLVAEDLDAPSG